MEEFVARVFKDGKVMVPKRLRELFRVEDGFYARLALVEVLVKFYDEHWNGLLYSTCSRKEMD
jgi:bifunctional DNA-binding transcriptional regulator/antitoxin component of YhaV-PrlF toxin-antitoxin module